MAFPISNGMKTKQFQMDFHGRPLVAEFTDLAEQTNGSVILKYGETMVMATVVMSENQREKIDYFPLTVDYEEKFYAAGKILGSRFVRREGKPSEEAVLNCRMIDRTLRPLFDKKIRNEIQVVTTALSVDEENDPDVLAILAASLTIATSDIPWGGPLGAVRIARIDGGFVVNPTWLQKEKADMELIICGKGGKINMIEGKAQQIPEEIILQVLESSLPEIAKLIDFQNKIVQEIGKPKKWPETKEMPENMPALFEKHVESRLKDVLSNSQDKEERNAMLGDLKKEWLEISEKEFGDEFFTLASDLYEKYINDIIHENILSEEKRPDGRKLDEIRPLYAKAGFLPRSHGSGVFYRGQTHILSVVTLGAPSDVLLIEGMEVREKRRFIHHYNFPPFAVGEIGRISMTNRREIGHGALAEKALVSIIPLKEDFPYTIRLVSETLSSNGSSSMGSVCASTIALMDAGVPIKAPVAGIAMGVMLGETKYKILTDIQGPEDHHGDTDFKAAGTEKGITAIQMDVKVEGLTAKILSDLLTQSKKARLQILKKILEAIAQPRANISPFAPHIVIVNINPEKIRELIGPGGKTVNKIREITGVEIDIEEDGAVFITGKNETDTAKAKELVEEVTYEPQIGDTIKGTVTRIFEFGAMVEIKPKTEGLIHISELASSRVNRVTDVVKPGDIVPVKIVSIDEMGRINLSLKQADPNYAGKQRKDNR